MSEELIRRLEQASGPSHELNMMIARECWEWLGCTYVDSDVPDFVGSIDAALTLWPDDGWPNIGKRRDHNDPNKTFYHAGFELGRAPYYCGGCAATIPLAMCIAALKATPSRGDPPTSQGGEG